MEQEKPSIGTRKTRWGLRIVAAALSVLLLCSLLLIDAVKVTIYRQTYGDTNVIAAAGNYLVDSTAYVSESALERAAQVVEGALTKPTTLEDFYNLASASIAKAEYANALACVDVCLEMAESSPDTVQAALYVDLLMKKGCLLALLNDYDQALLYFDRVIAIDSTQAQAQLLKTQIYAEQGETSSAIQSLLAYLALAPADYSMRAALVQLYYVQGNFLAAESACDEYLSLTYDNNGMIHFMRGASRLQNGGYEPAMEDLITAAKRGYEDPALCYGQAAICAYLLGKSGDVLSYGAEAIAIGSGQLDYGTLYSYMGLSSMLLEKFEDAAAQFTSAIEQGQPEAPMRYYRGVSRMAQGETADAIEDFTAAIEGGEATAQCYYNRGACYLQSGDRLKALEDMRTVAALDQDKELTAIARSLIEQLTAVG